MAIMDSRFIHQQPNPLYFPEQPVCVGFSQSAPYQQPVNTQFLMGAVLAALGGYALYKLCETEPQRRRCSGCGSKSHNVARCPHVGDRQHFSSEVEKTGWCKCCGHQFPKTQLHHYGGRADNGKAKEMCRPCHLHCGHSGHWGKFAINPRYCRLAD